MIFYNKGMEKTLLKEIISDQRRKALPLDFIERELESSIKESRSECVTIISGVKRLSRPGRRHYTTAARIPRVLGGFGVVILSTPKGLLTGAEARSQKLGGEVLCSVW